MTIMMICKKSYTLNLVMLLVGIRQVYDACVSLRWNCVNVFYRKRPEKAQQLTMVVMDVIIRLSDPVIMTQPVEERDF
jgi:hypothetical protein